MDKKALRAEIRAQKRALTPAQIDSASRALGALLRAEACYQNAKSIYGYLSYNQEVRTLPILAAAQRDGKRVAVPKVYGDEMKFIWLDDLSAIAKDNMDLARSKLINLMCNYKGVRQCELILVFDAYRIKGHVGSIEKVNNITVVYTKEAETADTYIEKATHELSRNYRVEVATSDRMEQIIIAGNGAARLSANEFRKQVDAAVAAMRDLMEEYALREKPSAKLAQGRIIGLDSSEKE